MRAELICVGTELLLGDILNTNAQYIARQLAKLGIDMYYQSVVGDNPDRLKETLTTALRRSELVILTGGLGPTKDDLTKETVCDLLGLELILHQPSMDAIETYYKNTCRQMTPNNVKQAYVPAGSKVFLNHHGSAPGCVVSSRKGHQHVVLLPGPPSECCPMVDEHLMPFLQAITGQTIYSTTLRVFGIGESALEPQVEDLLAGENPTAALYAKEGEVELRITAKAASEEAARAQCQQLADEVKRRLGDHVYGQDTSGLHHTAVELLIQKGLKISTAESCTGGLISQRITQVPGSSKVFDLGAATYAVWAKRSLLGIRKKFFKGGAVSEQVAARMAVGARRRGRADIGVGVTGVAGPGADENGNPEGLVYVGVAYKKTVYVQKLQLKNGNTSRDKIRHLASLHAFDMVRRIAAGLDCSAYTALDIKKLTAGDRWLRRLDGLRAVAFYLALCVFIGSLTLVGQYLYEGWQNKQQVSGLSSLYTDGKDVDVQLPEGYLPKFKSLYYYNQDIAGFLRIPQTQINYPIVQYSDNSYYLKVDYYDDYSRYGTLFFDYRNDLQARGENLVVYGHNMKDSQMFGDLTKYKDLDFYKKSPLIYMDTVYGEGVYKIFAVFTANTDPSVGEVFDYYNRLNFVTAEAYDQFVSELKARSLIDTGVDVQFDDRLLTLSTCEYDYDGQRLVVVARQVRDGEEAKVDTSAAKKNPDPVLPVLYKK